MAASTPEIPSLVPDNFQAELSKILEDVPAEQEVLVDNIKVWTHLSQWHGLELTSTRRASQMRCR
jgi:hypothetical protein